MCLPDIWPKTTENVVFFHLFRDLRTMNTETVLPTSITTKTTILNQGEGEDKRQESRKIHFEIKQHLGGKNLACWCPADKPCHVDILLEIANP